VTKRSKPPTTAPQTRVAIYTRQSVASDLEFGSIQAQREAVEAYVTSQRGEGWIPLPTRYDDHGFSGGNTDRPGFQRLLADVAAGKVDVIAAYKIDRVSRSLPDFTGFMTLLERHNVGFVSTTQSFDTRTSMGRLTLNILASFSQFEREVISERTRDKIHATRRKGMFTGGRPILGFDVVDRRLVLNAAEAETVRTIFAVYLEHCGLVATVEELARRGIRNKSWTTQQGKQIVGRPFDKTSLHTLLTNPVVTGRVRCGDELVEGQHDAIIDRKLFTEVQRALQENVRPFRATPGRHGAVLAGILRCGRCGAAMTHSANARGPRLHRYYTCVTAQKQGAASCPGSRAPARELEDVVLNQIRCIGSDPELLLATVTAAHRQRVTQQPALAAEARRIANERTVLAGQRSNLINAIENGVAANTLAHRLAELDELIRRSDASHKEILDQMATIQGGDLDETAVRSALTNFGPVWDSLAATERQRVLHLLIETVTFDAAAGEVEIEFRDSGIHALSREVSERRPA
jgi:site-specific DNA recombinase